MGCPRECTALTSRRKGGLRPDSIASDESGQEDDERGLGTSEVNEWYW